MTATPREASAKLGRILVVDDEPDAVEMLSVYFTTASHEVLGASHGGDALMLASLQRPDVVLLDIRMPGIDGVEVLQQIGARWPDIPVIMVTAAADVELAKSTLQRGAFDHAGGALPDSAMAAARTSRSRPISTGFIT